MSYPISCSFTSIPITDGQEVVVIPIYQNEYRKEEFGFYHSITDLYKPYLHPIHCKYFGDGIFSDIQENLNTVIIEKIFNVTITDFIEKITGYSNIVFPTVYIENDIPIESMIVLKKTYDKFVTHSNQADEGQFENLFKKLKKDFETREVLIGSTVRTLKELNKVLLNDSENNELKELIRIHEEILKERQAVHSFRTLSSLNVESYNIYMDFYDDNEETIVDIIKELLNCQLFMKTLNISYLPNITGHFKEMKDIILMKKFNEHQKQLIEKMSIN